MPDRVAEHVAEPVVRLLLSCDRYSHILLGSVSVGSIACWSHTVVTRNVIKDLRFSPGRLPVAQRVQCSARQGGALCIHPCPQSQLPGMGSPCSGLRALQRELQPFDSACGPLQPQGCWEVNMESLYASLPSRNRELWALIRLTEGMAPPDHLSGPVCAPDRGALAYQVSAVWCQASPLQLVSV